MVPTTEEQEPPGFIIIITDCSHNDGNTLSYKKQGSGRPGAKSLVTDIFGTWVPYGTLAAEDVIHLPDPFVQPEMVLEFGFTLTEALWGPICHRT